MKKILIYLTSLFFMSLSAQEKIWQRKAGGKYADFLFDGIATLDYGFLLAGASVSDIGKTKDKGNYDYLLSKYTEHGDKEWDKTYGGKATDYLKQVTLASDGGYLLSGISNSGIGGLKTTPNIGQFDIWLLKLDINGQISWQKTLGGLAREQISQVIRTQDGGFLIAGSSASQEFIPSGSTYAHPDLIIKEGTAYGNMDYWLIKLNARGELQWQKTFGGPYKDVLQQVIELPDQSLILAGNSNSPAAGNKSLSGKGKSDWWLLKTDKHGNLIWQKSFGDDADDKITAMIFTQDKHVLLGGYHTYIDTKTRKNKADIVLRKINTHGDLIWQETYDNNGDDFLTNLIENKDRSLILGAYSTQHQAIKNALGKGKDDFLLIKTDAKGDELWRRNIGSPKKEVLKKIIATRDGGYVLMGSSMPAHAKGAGNADFLMVKIADKDKPLQEKLPLEAIPNPAKLYTQAVIGKDYKKGRLQLFDLNGRVLLQKDLQGERIVPLPMRQWPDGVYIIHIRADKSSNSVKVIKGKG